MNKIIVIGSGVMGSGIAAHIANSGVAVVMLDIVPEGAENRNILTETAVERMLYEEKSPFSLPSNAQLITCGNLEDDLGMVEDADWIIEAVVENLGIKQSIYRKIEQLRKSGSLISSNTSTIPLHILTEGMPGSVCRDMLITHFFNPPRIMRLVELVTETEELPPHISNLVEFIDRRLGKTIIRAKDTPGFIANRVGIFWLITALTKALEMGISVEEADSLMGKPAGMPKTGIFSLMDLVGIDLIPLLAESMLRYLPASDSLHRLYKEPALMRQMTRQGYTGKKGKGGFYRLHKRNGIALKEVMDIQLGQYRLQQEVTLESSQSKGVKALVTSSDKGGAYAWQVLSHLLVYACDLIPEAADNILDIDTAMKTGFNWKYGPFELIDQLGTVWFREKLQQENRQIPVLLEKVGNKNFYEKGTYFSARKAEYNAIPFQKDAWAIADITRQSKPVLHNNSARLWDIGDGIACLEFTTKMNSLDPDIFTLMKESITLVQKHFRGLLIGNDKEHFSVGLNLNIIQGNARNQDYTAISDIIRQGQEGMMRLKYASFPVVVAVSGMVLGGACEMLMHADAVQAHIDSVIGLVESKIGVIPAWGGCTALLFRRLNDADAPDERMNAIFSIFKMIAFAKKTYSAEDARQQGIINALSHITMNRQRLLADAKSLCISLTDGYQKKTARPLHLSGVVIQAALGMTINGMEHNGQITDHDKKLLFQLSNVLSAGRVDIAQPVTEQQLLDLEHDAFMRLIRTEQTHERINYTLRTGKPLKN